MSEFTGGSVVATDRLRLGDRYSLLDILGRGGMADVYRAHDDVLDRMVAVKVFRSPADTPTDAGRIRQHAEVRALAALNHPNLTTLYDASVDGDPAFLVLELIDGPSLAMELARGPLPEPNARSIGIQVADALAYVHAHGMVHRDVKPANVLLGSDAANGDAAWRVRLSDFGIVRLIGSERLTQVDMTVGSASYLAPEQARGSDVGPAADIYSLGLVLIEALTGRCCFQGTAPEALAQRLARTPDVPMNAPAPWPQLLSAMTAIEPSARPSAVEVARALRDPRLDFAAAPTSAMAAAPLLEPAVPPLTPVDDEPEPRRRHHVGLIAAGLLALAAAGVIAILHSGLPGLPDPHQSPAGNGTSQSGQQGQPANGGTPLRQASVIGSSAPQKNRPNQPAATHSKPSAKHSTSSVRVVAPPPTHVASTPPAVTPTPTSTPTPTPTPTPTTSNPSPSPNATGSSSPTGP